MGPEIQLTMVARLYIMRSIYDSTRRLLLLVDMSCAMLDEMWQKIGIRERMGMTRQEKLVKIEESKDSAAAREEVEGSNSKEEIEESQKFKSSIPKTDLVENHFEEAETGTKMADNLNHRTKKNDSKGEKETEGEKEKREKEDSKSKFGRRHRKYISI